MIKYIDFNETKEKIEVGFRIKDLRQLKNISVEGLANQAKVTHSYIELIENGVKFPTAKLFIRLSDIFNVSLDYLMRGREWICKK